MNITDRFGTETPSDLAQRYHVCQTCQSVDNTMTQLVPGTPCVHCKVPSPYGMTFFNESVLLLIELLQEAFKGIPELPEPNRTIFATSEHVHTTSAVIVFCTLKELLLERLLGAMMTGQRLPEPVCRRLIADNNTHTQRLSRLFPALATHSWEDALSAIDSRDATKFTDLSHFLKKIADIRNDFVHDGRYLSLDRDLATEVVDNILPMLSMFVALHNEYVHPLYMGGKPTAPNRRAPDARTSV
jgi:hypothetical protein